MFGWLSRAAARASVTKRSMDSLSSAGLDPLLLAHGLALVDGHEVHGDLHVARARHLAGARQEVPGRLHEAAPALDEHGLLHALEVHDAVLARELPVEDVLVDRLGARAHAVRAREAVEVDHILVPQHLLERDAEREV